MEFVAFFLFKRESFKDILAEMLRVEGRKEEKKEGREHKCVQRNNCLESKEWFWFILMKGTVELLCGISGWKLISIVSRLLVDKGYRCRMGWIKYIA